MQLAIIFLAVIEFTYSLRHQLAALLLLLDRIIVESIITYGILAFVLSKKRLVAVWVRLLAILQHVKAFLALLFTCTLLIYVGTFVKIFWLRRWPWLLTFWWRLDLSERLFFDMGVLLGMHTIYRWWVVPGGTTGLLNALIAHLFGTYNFDPVFKRLSSKLLT